MTRVLGKYWLLVLAAPLIAGCGGRYSHTVSDDAEPEPPVSEPTLPNLSGEYTIESSGQRNPCTVPGSAVMTEPLPQWLRLTVEQNPQDRTRGTVLVNGTGEALLDTRLFEAVFDDSSFSVALDGPLSPTCNQRYALAFVYDFASQGGGSGRLDLDFEQTTMCQGNPGKYCTGKLSGTLGTAHKVGLK